MRLLICLFVLINLTWAQQAPVELYSYNGRGIHDRFGLCTRLAGDVNGDGTDDIIVSAPGDDTVGPEVGVVRVHSGVDGSILYTLPGLPGYGWYGHRVDGLGDVNLDGYADFVVACSFEPLPQMGNPEPRIFVYSGFDGGELYTISVSPTLSLGSIRDLCRAGDVDNDGIEDILVGHEYYNMAIGAASVFSGANGTLIHQFDLSSSGVAFGPAVAAAGDVDNDGHADLLVSAPFTNSSGTASGSVYVFSGQTGLQLRQMNGSYAFDHFGRSIAGAGDINADGVPDFMIGVPGDDTVKSNAGKVMIISGSDGATLYQYFGDEINGRFGAALSSAGDIDSDGFGEYLIGYQGSDVYRQNSGVYFCYSGIDGGPVYFDFGSLPEEQVGISVSRLSDLNGDGFPEYSVTSQLGGDHSDLSGRVVIYNGFDGTELFHLLHESGGADEKYGQALGMVGDINSDGFPDFAMASPLATADRIENGFIEFRSGIDGSVLHSETGVVKSALGSTICRAGDYDGDGIDDYILADPESLTSGGSGRVFVRSGADHSVIRSFPSTGLASNYGRAVSVIGDVDADGTPEIAIAYWSHLTPAPPADERVAVVSEPAGFSLALYYGDNPGDDFGCAIAGGGDFNGDGSGDLIVGAKSDDDNGIDCGSVRVFSIVPNIVAYTIYGDSAGDAFGTSVSIVGDVNQDGRSDFIVGAPFDDDNGTDCGSARVYSGVDGAVLYSFFGDAAGDEFGTVVVGLDDINNDGFGDFMVTAPKANGTGRIRVYSGFDGSPIAQSDGLAAGDRFGMAAAACGDLNGDGKPEIMVGAPFADTNGLDSGNAKVLTLNPSPVATFQPNSLAAQLQLTWMPVGNDPEAAIGSLHCHGATPGALGLFGVSWAPIDINYFGVPLLIAPDSVNLIDQGGFGFDLFGEMTVPGVTRQYPILAGTTVYLQLFEVQPWPKGSNGLSMMLIP